MSRNWSPSTLIWGLAEAGLRASPLTILASPSMLPLKTPPLLFFLHIIDHQFNFIVVIMIWFLVFFPSSLYLHWLDESNRVFHRLSDLKLLLAFQSKLISTLVLHLDQSKLNKTTVDRFHTICRNEFCLVWTQDHSLKFTAYLWHYEMILRLVHMFELAALNFQIVDSSHTKGRVR